MKKHYQQHVFWKGGSAPATPDYEAQALEQGKVDLQAQQEATQANRVNQSNPWGSLNWSQTTGADGKPVWQQSVSLDPAEQAKLDSQRGIEGDLMGTASGMTGRVGDAYSNPFSMEGAPEAGKAGFDVSKEYQDAIMSRMAPDLLRQRQRQEAQLIAQGVGGNTNSGAWDRAQQDLGRNETDASMQALMKGYDVANTEFDKSNIARQNWTTEQQMLRDRPMTELLNTLRGVSPASNPVFNDFAKQGVAAGADLSGATGAKYAADMNTYNAKQQQIAQNQQAGAGVAAAALVML